MAAILKRGGGGRSGTICTHHTTYGIEGISQNDKQAQYLTLGDEPFCDETIYLRISSVLIKSAVLPSNRTSIHSHVGEVRNYGCHSPILDL